MLPLPPVGASSVTIGDAIGPLAAASALLASAVLNPVAGATACPTTIPAGNVHAAMRKTWQGRQHTCMGPPPKFSLPLISRHFLPKSRSWVENNRILNRGPHRKTSVIHLFAGRRFTTRAVQVAEPIVCFVHQKGRWFVQAVVPVSMTLNTGRGWHEFEGKSAMQGMGQHGIQGICGTQLSPQRSWHSPTACIKQP